ncbi:MAG TPA: phosphate ABC transporter permease subunit PstC [Bacteroidales bacterium]|nr:phosphate ABC transporter permease subunit PstC [Bacteroidales bacterium]HPR58818.1 phosphate ABC transporter permease subunit PstC [Bacteroidales bacterium]HRW97511.1 phosphate ABC transporter permease subunit PstC [Bacteroidales bacterium]
MNLRRFNIERHLRNRMHTAWMLCSLVVVMVVPLLLFAGLAYKSLPLLSDHSVLSLIFSREWKPMSGHFGFYTFIISSLWVTVLALLIAAPVCLLTAIHLTQYARRWVLHLMHPVIDLLSGIPSVIIGVWGILVIVPAISKYVGPFFGKTVSGYSILAGSVVLAIMIIPFILNILIELFQNIPVELKEASLSLGATKWQTIKLVLIRKIMPGIVSSFALGMSRAFGETIAVLMVVGNVTQIPKSIFHPGYPLPALIANNYGEMLSVPLYDSALMLAALILFVIVICFHFLSRIVVIRSEKFQ